jgi:hypothetical protein
MHASTFRRELQRIDRQSRGKESDARKAIKQLVHRTGAAALIEGDRIIGYRMRDGSVACTKVRYKTSVDALDDLCRIARLPNREHKPVRDYRCPWCSGYHLTSRQA